MTSRTRTCHFLPPYLVERTHPGMLERDQSFRAARQQAPRQAASPLSADGPDWVVHTAGNTAELPGTPARSSGESETGDAAVDEAAAGISGTLEMFLDVFERDSYDGNGIPVSLTVHYERDYANAFWDGQQLVFGDGDGTTFDRFTKPVDVLAHEFGHAVTELTAGLVYEGQAGALNESLSDVYGSCLKQRLLGQDAGEADWVVGEGIFLAGVNGRGLRDMKNPGTAYDDPQLGKDPQPAHMDDYVDTTDDNGGVHINSGIPNRAFVLAAEAIGGSSAEGAGRIWYAAATGGAVGADTDFAGFAAATIAAAGEHAQAVTDAWAGVGVTPAEGGSAGTPQPGEEAPSGSPGRVKVRRTGGFAAIPAESEVELTGDDDTVSELRDLVGRVDLAQVASSGAAPDRFVYEVDIDGDTTSITEPDLTPELRRIVQIVLDR